MPGRPRWAVRNAYGQFVPRVDVNGGMAYFGAGSSTFGGTTFNQTSSALSSSYGIDLSLNLNGSTLLGPATEKANQRAVEEDINNAQVTLDNDVTVQYLAALQAGAQTDVRRQQVQRNTEFLELARARFQVGQATLLDVPPGGSDQGPVRSGAAGRCAAGKRSQARAAASDGDRAACVGHRTWLSDSFR